MNRKYRRAVIAANWKMNKTPSETRDFCTTLRGMLPRSRWCDIILCMPAIDIPSGMRVLKDTRVAIGAENIHEKASGAVTGEIAGSMLADAGVKYVIVGHSERREMGESDARVAAKLRAVLDNGMSAILCVGESLEQRELGVTEEWIAMQLKIALSVVKPEELKKVIIAYEPIWAIGTGKTATPEQAQEVCEFVRSVVRKLYGARPARSVPVLYGGSMNEKNAYDLLAKPDIDGGLIGGASLDPEKFLQIIHAANQSND